MKWKDRDFYTLDDIQKMCFRLDLKEEIHKREADKAAARAARNKMR